MYVISVAVCSAILLIAAYQDWKTREVDDRCWMAICVLGSIVMFLISHNAMALLGDVLLTAMMFSEYLSGWRAVPPAMAASACLMLAGDANLVMTPVMFFAVYGMYCTGILRGGADAKALMSIAVAFPFFPDNVIIEPLFPSGYVFNPCFCTLLTALAMTVIVAALYAVLNTRNENGFTVSRTMKLNDARKSFVWPVEDVRDGKKIRIKTSDDASVYERIENAGFDEVEVEWKIPFIVPVAASFLFTMTVGSPLFLLQRCQYSP